MLRGVSHIETPSIVPSATLGWSEAILVLGKRFLCGAELPLDEWADLLIFVRWGHVKSLGLISLVSFGRCLVLRFDV